MTSPQQGPTISRIISGLVCPLCGRSLVPVSADGGLSFHCKADHEWDLPALTNAASPLLHSCLVQLLESWEREIDQTRSIVEHASSRGYFGIADVFARQIPRLSTRVRALSSVLRTPFPSVTRERPGTNSEVGGR